MHHCTVYLGSSAAEKGADPSLALRYLGATPHADRYGRCGPFKGLLHLANGNSYLHLRHRFFIPCDSASLPLSGPTEFIRLYSKMPP